MYGVAAGGGPTLSSREWGSLGMREISSDNPAPVECFNATAATVEHITGMNNVHGEVTSRATCSLDTQENCDLEADGLDPDFLIMNQQKQVCCAELSGAQKAPDVEKRSDVAGVNSLCEADKRRGISQAYFQGLTSSATPNHCSYSRPRFSSQPQSAIVDSMEMRQKQYFQLMGADLPRKHVYSDAFLEGKVEYGMHPRTSLDIPHTMEMVSSNEAWPRGCDQDVGFGLPLDPLSSQNVDSDFIDVHPIMRMSCNYTCVDVCDQKKESSTVKQEFYPVDVNNQEVESNQEFQVGSRVAKYKQGLRVVIPAPEAHSQVRLSSSSNPYQREMLYGHNKFFSASVVQEPSINFPSVLGNEGMCSSCSTGYEPSQIQFSQEAWPDSPVSVMLPMRTPPFSGKSHSLEEMYNENKSYPSQMQAQIQGSDPQCEQIARSDINRDVHMRHQVVDGPEYIEPQSAHGSPAFHREFDDAGSVRPFSLPQNLPRDTASQTQVQFQSDAKQQMDNFFRCKHPGCNKIFPKLYNLKSHVICHSDRKPHKCNICTKAFARKHDLQRHLRTIHPAGCPFRCGNCNGFFSDPEALLKHKMMERSAQERVKSIGVRKKNGRSGLRDLPQSDCEQVN